MLNWKFLSFSGLSDVYLGFRESFLAGSLLEKLTLIVSAKPVLCFYYEFCRSKLISSYLEICFDDSSIWVIRDLISYISLYKLSLMVMNSDRSEAISSRFPQFGVRGYGSPNIEYGLFPGVDCCRFCCTLVICSSLKVML